MTLTLEEMLENGYKPKLGKDRFQYDGKSFILVGLDKKLIGTTTIKSYSGSTITEELFDDIAIIVRADGVGKQRRVKCCKISKNCKVQ